MEKDDNEPKPAAKAPVKPKTKRKKPTHYIVNSEMLEEVKKSKKRLEENPELGGQALTKELASMFVRLVDHYATKKNWAGYSYIDELKGEALVNLVNKWHKFDSDKYDKPFAYYSMFVERSFKGQIQKEKKPQKVKDAIITARGEMPSYAAQEEYEKEWQEKVAQDTDASESWDNGQNDRFYNNEDQDDQ
jgi:DNA-directed RNA polymerase specialized sigma subunit